MQEIIQVDDRYYILATSSLGEQEQRVLKQGDMFAIFDRHGDMHSLGLGEQGLYFQDTRFLSHFRLRLGGQRPLLLSSTVKDDNVLLVADLMNPDLRTEEGRLQSGRVHVSRHAFLWQQCCYHRVTLDNYGRSRAELSLSLEIDADFVDLFEVRGMERERRGERLPAAVEGNRLTLGYEGLDGLVRRTHLAFAPSPSMLSEQRAAFQVSLAPGERKRIVVTTACEVANGRPTVSSYETAHRRAQEDMRRLRQKSCQLVSSNEQFNEWTDRSLDDLLMMVTDTEKGDVYPYAGVPWYNTAFGRDGIIAAMESLWINPDVAHGVLQYLADTQADREIPEQDAEPGKIVHETRRGEMARTGEIPFQMYYGTIDATPLYVMLAGDYYRYTGDLDLVRSLWFNIKAALQWIDHYGDVDGDGFVEYRRKASKGLDNQGWKDSHDAVFYEDGTMAEGPIALCEVQGYVYQAKQQAAGLAAALGEDAFAEELRGQAQTLREQFEDAFWLEEMGTYALALDGQKRPCRVRTSNAGHCLFTGIAGPERAERVVQTLFDETSYCGWGIRTLATSEQQYNPMSYHNGSVWPHDNALIGRGLARYGHKEEVLKLLRGFFDASQSVDLHRLPELFCGFPKRRGQGPTLYPVACLPQAWASASVFMLLQAALGLSIRAQKQELRFEQPRLPPFLEEVRLRNVQVGEASVNVLLRRHAEDVGVNVTRRTGAVRVVVVK